MSLAGACGASEEDGGGGESSLLGGNPELPGWEIGRGVGAGLDSSNMQALAHTNNRGRLGRMIAPWQILRILNENEGLLPLKPECPPDTPTALEGCFRMGERLSLPSFFAIQFVSRLFSPPDPPCLPPGRPSPTVLP